MKSDNNAYPLSPYERGMYLEQKLDPSSTVYNLVYFFEMDGADADKLKTAVEEIFRAHEAFRSRNCASIPPNTRQAPNPI